MPNTARQSEVRRNRARYIKNCCCLLDSHRLFDLIRHHTQPCPSLSITRTSPVRRCSRSPLVFTMGFKRKFNDDLEDSAAYTVRTTASRHAANAHVYAILRSRPLSYLSASPSPLQSPTPTLPCLTPQTLTWTMASPSTFTPAAFPPALLRRQQTPSLHHVRLLSIL